MPDRIIFHVDLDAFFASAEVKQHPEYAGKPLVVGADPKGGKGRGVVSTASYEARKFGVKSGMPISRAWKLCPHCIFVPVNFRLYGELSSKIMAILRKYAGKFEQGGIDEAFLDVTGKVRDLKEAEALARKIKEEIYSQVGLTCSIGIAPNKSVAKVASDYKKPNGLVIVTKEGIEKFLFPQPTKVILGVGKKTENALADMGIKTVGDLAKTEPEKLVSRFGKMGLWLYRAAHGMDDSEVIEVWEQKSIGRLVTFETDTKEVELIFSTLESLAKEVHEEVTESGFSFKTVEIRARYEDFETHTHSKTLPFHTDSLEALDSAAKELLLPFLYSEKKIRLIGVRVMNLVKGEKQKTLREAK